MRHQGARGAHRRARRAPGDRHRDGGGRPGCLNIADEKIKKEVDAAKAAVIGKHYSFTGCTFASQGNDEVGFASATGGEPTIRCTMKDGEKGVDTFRHAAMDIGQDKVRLDVSGELAVGGMKGFESVGLRSCEISVHD
jgi:hypothetical protein